MAALDLQALALVGDMEAEHAWVVAVLAVLVVAETRRLPVWVVGWVETLVQEATQDWD